MLVQKLFITFLLLPFLILSQEDPVVLTLETALSRALNYNRQLQNTVDGEVKAEYNLSLAESEFDIDYSPNGRTGYTGGKKEGTGVAAGCGIDISKKFTTGTVITLSPSFLKTPDHYHTTLNVLVAQPLLRGFGKEYQLANIKGAQFGLRSARRNLYIAQVQLVIRTTQAMYEVIKAHKALELNNESYERVKRAYQAAKLKEKIGLSESLDVYRAEIELQSAEDSLVTSQERLQDTEDTLRDILALPLNAPLKIELPLIYTESKLNPDQGIQLALENRIEMDQAEDQWRESFRLSKIAKNRLLPDISVLFDYTSCGFDEVFTDSCFCKRENKWGVGFTTNGDFNPTGEQYAYEESLMAINSSERGMEQTKATLTLEVKKAIRNLQRAFKRIALQEEQIHSSEGQLYLAQLKFERGMANNFDVIQAEKTLRTAQITYWSAIIDHIVGEFQLLAAIGLLTDKPCI